MAPPKISTASKRLRGTIRPCRENAAEPILPPGTPIMPKELTKTAKRYWPLVIAELDIMAILATADVFAIAGLAQALGDLQDARKALAKRDGQLSYQDAKGVWKPYPELAMVASADRRVYGWVSKLGLTPSDRSKVSAIKAKEPEEDLSVFKPRVMNA